MILDTSFLIDLMDGDDDAEKRKDRLLSEHEAFKVSAATIFELWTGIYACVESGEEKSKVLNALAGIDVVNATKAVAEKAGEIHGILIKEGKVIDSMDALIASSAILENEPVLTRNVKDFGKVKGLRVEVY